MILTKDLQEILEGVHYFLAEALTTEQLSGRAECLRRGLVMQLEALAGVYPALRIHPTHHGGIGGAGPRGAGSSASLPYLPMDQTLSAKGTGQHSTPAYTHSSSSSGVNSHSSSNSSSGSSGDGLVVGGSHGGGGVAPLREEGGGGGGGGGVGEMEEEYEEFEGMKEEDAVENKPDRGEGGGGREEAEDKEDDGVYMETDDPVPFSSLIASCERHGPLGKRSKGLLKQVKTYLCVAAGGMLYLYLRETDDRQKKTIDLTGYMARAATGEEIKDARKRDAAFEIVCPGKKTHTFIARTARDKTDWLDAIARTIRNGRTRSPNLSITTSSDTRNIPTRSPVFFIPLKPSIASPAQPLKQTADNPAAEEYKYYHDVADEVQEEVYEEIGGELGEEGDSFLAPLPPSLHAPTTIPPPPLPHLAFTTTTAASSTPLLEYDPIEPEDPPTSGPAPPRPPPPTRPPLPSHLLRDMQTDRSLPLAPVAGEGGGEGGAEEEEEDDGVYCEIEEDLLEAARQAFPASSLGIDPGASTQVGSLSEDVFRNLSSFPKPQPPPHFIQKGSTTPPRLPPKGPSVQESDESEYKVPMSTNMEYQVPSSTPVPTEASRGTRVGTAGLHDELTNRLPQRTTREGVNRLTEGTTKAMTQEGVKEASAEATEISAPIPSPASILQVPHAQTIMPIKSLERRTSQKEENKGTVSSFLGGSKDAPRSSRSPTGTSVKDMIARLNQNRASQAAGDSPSPQERKGEEGERKDPASSDTFTLPKQHLRPDKPALPPRPFTNREGSPQPPPETQQEEEEEEEIYEELDEAEDIGGDQDPQQGEWYVAKFAFVATLPQALSFDRGDELLIYDMTGDSGWWRARLKGRSGLVPREYLRRKE